jgi:hypothetical protein
MLNVVNEKFPSRDADVAKGGGADLTAETGKEKRRMTGRKTRLKICKCKIHHTTTATEQCVMCLALARSKKAHPLPDGSVELDLHEEEAKREEAIRGQSMDETLDSHPCRKQTGRGK